MTEVTFTVGDLIHCQYDAAHEGTLYRIVELQPHNLVKLKPVMCVFGELSKKRTRVIGAGWCKKITAQELLSAQRNLEAFVGGVGNGVK